MTITDTKTRSLKFGIVGSGQSGSRLSFSFSQLGYPAVAINTAQQDLEHIDLPEDCKLLLQFGLGGAAKELEIGRLAAEQYRDEISELISNQLDDANLLILCLSLGGGSGAGSASVLIDIMAMTGKPVMAIAVLPMTNEDVKTKSNALETLSLLTKEVQSGRLCNLALIDNAKIETLYSEVSQINFYSVSNQAIISPLDAFNHLSSTASPVKGLDPAELGKLLTSNGLCVYGEMTISDYQEESAIADAVLANLSDNLLTGGFNLGQAKYAGFILAASKSVWETIPSSAINYTMARLEEVCETPDGVFKGIYVVPSTEDKVTVYSIFSGLGLPESRVEELKEEVRIAKEKSHEKENKRALGLKLDTGDSSVAAATKLKQGASLRKSGFGYLMGTNKAKK